MKNNRRILWVDDDPQERFSYEIEVLTKDNNYQIEWASTVYDAMSILCSDKFDVILLDQMLPLKGRFEQIENWGGCFLLYWLRGNLEKFKQTLYQPELEKYEPIDQLDPPKAENKNIPVILVSAINDDKLLSVTRSVNPGSVDIPLISKPISIEQLVKVLEAV